MFPLFFNRQHGVLKRFDLRAAALPLSIKLFHQGASRAIIDMPKTGKQRSRSSIEKPAHEAQQFVAACHSAQTRPTSAECDEVGLRPQRVKVQSGKPPVRQLQTGEHWIVVPKPSMSSHVDKP